ncbi:hypothetical protein N7493_003467 [Penicillium malachiteum]|uniref:Uncharacterized protein n=1 Tax=Penicillium malachiteum TaxID=1324776 RepID=A0AAD6HPP6_9EURO|nr:hypothetical protein N7493_003467 [Penicillium malachiteum]
MFLKTGTIAFFSLGLCSWGSGLNCKSVPWPSILKQEQVTSSAGPVNVFPVSVVKGISSAFKNGSSTDSLVFQSVGDIYTLDYGEDVAGKPLFHITSVKGNPQIEVTYTEAFDSYGIGDLSPYIPGGAYKGFAFDPWQDQAAYYRNVKATLNSNNETLYSNFMTDQDVLIEYGVQTNDEYTCSDSGKRDRFAWLGDRIMSARAVMITSGQVPANTLFSPLDVQGTLIRTANVDTLVVDYNFDIMQIIYDYWMRSGNDTFLEEFWPQMVMTTSYAISRALDLGTQLFGEPFGSLGTSLSGEKGQALGPANTVPLILGLEHMAEMAEYLGDYATAHMYKGQAQLSRDAIETQLWNKTGGYYTATLGGSGYDLMDIAQVLLAGIGTEERRERFVEKLDSLKVPAGYINGTRFFDTLGVVNPYYMSFLLEGLAITNRTELAQELQDATWAPMVRRDRNYTGGYWEYISTDATYAGLDLFSGISHFWGSYPTVFLMEYALGVRATKPGYQGFLFAPMPGFKTDWVQGRVPTPSGLILPAWGYNTEGKIVMEIEAPTGLYGTLVPPFDGEYWVDELQGQTGKLTFTGGKKMVIFQK